MLHTPLTCPYINIIFLICQTKDLKGKLCKTNKNKVYHIGIPTKTTKTTKSLVVVLRFCSKLKNAHRALLLHFCVITEFRATQPTPSLRITCGGRNAHRAGPLLHGTGDADAEKEKADKAPGAECRKKPFAPVANASRGQRAI